MAVGIVVHGCQLAPALVVEVGESHLIYLCAILILRTAYLECSGVEVLIHVGTVKPVFTDGTVQIQRIFLLTEVVGLVVERAMESLLAKLCPRVDSIADVTRCYCCLRDFQQSHMTMACIGAPVGVDTVRICSKGNGETVFQYVDISRRQTYLNLARSVGTGGVEHHVAVALFLAVVLTLLCTHIKRCTQDCGCNHNLCLRQIEMLCFHKSCFFCYFDFVVQNYIYFPRKTSVRSVLVSG